MSKALTRRVFFPLAPKVVELMKRHGIELEVGDHVIDRDGSIKRIGKINIKGIELESRWNSDDWSHYGTIKFDEWTNREYIKVEGDPDQAMIKTLSEVADLSGYEEDQTPSESKDLMVVGDKNHLIQMKKSAEIVARKLELMNRLLNRKRNELQNIMRGYLEKVKAIQKVIGLIELYLGIHEQLVQIGEGQAAPADTPISLRQQVLFMDEELGDPTEGGIDFRRIEEFDKWLATDNNIAKLLPEEKGVVAIKTRRSKLEYSSDWFTNSLMNAENEKIYILIRNGANLYRIWTEHLRISERMFPLRKEMKLLNAAVENGGAMHDDDDNLVDDDADRSEHHISHMSESDAKKQLERYRKTMLMLQGLLDRSEVFNPISHPIQLHKPETYGDMVRFIYDDELALGDGHLTWSDWRKKMNSAIVRGTRVYFNGFWTGFGSPYTSKADYWESRFPWNLRRMAHWNSPDAGVYSVVRIEVTGKFSDEGEGKNGFILQYNPKEKVYRRRAYWQSDDDSPRKRSIPFTVFASDEFVFNYDLLDLKDIEFYIHSRVDRRNYLRMLPTLYGLRRMRLAELEWERGFVEHLVGRLQGQDPKKAEASVWAAMEWWKRKVIWKRPLTKDDSKALRMITWKVKKEFGLKTTREDLLLPETLLKERKEKRKKRK